MAVPTGSIEHFPSLDEIERRESLFEEITRHSHIQTTDLPPRLKMLASDSFDSPMAFRDDQHKFGITQILYGVLKAGSHGFGFVTAYGEGMPKSGQPYVSHITEDPYRRKPKLLTQLFPGATITLGGKSKLVPGLTGEGQHFTVSANDNAEVCVVAKEHKRAPLQLITASGLSSERKRPTPLEDQVGTWSLPPCFLRKLARVT